jgi:hypothetical protein
MWLRKWNKRGSTDDDETSLSNSRSVDAALPRPDAIWLLYASQVCGNGSIRYHGVPLLYEQ